MRRIRKTLAAACSALAVTAGLLAFADPAEAATLNVSLTASGTGSSATFDSMGNPVLTEGSSAGSFAEMTINSPPATAPATAPTLITDFYAGGSPRWFITFAGGDSLSGHPDKAGGGLMSWSVITPSSGTCASASAPANVSYPPALAFLQAAGACGGNVTGAGIIADTGQSAGTSDTINDISYDGMTLPGDVVTVTSPGPQTSTAGLQIALLQIKVATIRGNIISSFTAAGLPPGLAIAPTAGVISGTPTTAGTYPVTITATDDGGTAGTATFTWTVNPSGPTVTYSGTIRLVDMGLCLDDRLNSSSPGSAVVQVWSCNGQATQQWQVMSDGTIRHNSLCLSAAGGGTANGTKLVLDTCAGTAGQMWDTGGWRVHYDNPAAVNKVLDDTASGGSGTQQEIYTNNGGANQIWGTA